MATFGKEGMIGRIQGGGAEIRVTGGAAEDAPPRKGRGIAEDRKG